MFKFVGSTLYVIYISLICCSNTKTYDSIDRVACSVFGMPFFQSYNDETCEFGLQ